MEENSDIERQNRKRRVILIVILVLLVSTFISVFKLSNFITKPKTLFDATIESVFSDYNTLMNDINNNKFYLLFSKNKIKVESAVVVKSSSLEDKELEEKLKTIKFSGNTLVDRKNSYANISLDIQKDNETLTNISYVKRDYETFLKVDKLMNNFFLLDEIGQDYSQFDANKNIMLSDIIKQKLSSNIENDKFKTSEKEVYINNKKYDCKVSAYTFDGSTLKDIYNSIVDEIDKNEDLKLYLSRMYKMDKKKVIKLLRQKYDDFGLKSEDTITLSSYTQKGNDQIVSLVVDTSNKKIFKKFFINKSDNYMLIDYQADKDTFTIEFKNKDKKVINYSDTNKKISLILNEDDSGYIDIIDPKTDERILKGDFEYKVSDTLEKVNLKLDVKLVNEDKEKITINSTSIISKVDDINLTKPKYDKKLSEKSMDKLYDDVIKIIKKS